MSIQTKTLSVRVKDKHAKVSREMAYEVNQVVNLANELTIKANCRTSDHGPVKPVWLSAFDVQKQTAGIRKERGCKIGSASVQEIIAIHGKAKKQFKKAKLRWRISSGSKRSLGFVPFKSCAAKWVSEPISIAVSQEESHCFSCGRMLIH